MTRDSEQLLRERFARLANPADDSDWTEVRRRAGAGLRPRLLLLAAATVVVAALAAPALGLSGKVIQLFESSDPAPSRVVEDFATLDVGAPKGMATGVIAEQTRKVIDIPSSEGGRSVLWVAPTKAGGFCMTTGFARRADSKDRELGGGCDRDRVLPFSVGFGAPGPISPTGEVLRGPVLYSGSVLIEEAHAVVFDFEDRTLAKVPVIWVSEPINAGFFVYSVPAKHWSEGHQPVSVTLEDEDENALVRERAYWFPKFPTRDR